MNDHGEKGDKGEPGEQGSQGNQGNPGPPADHSELAGLALAMEKLAMAATSLATSNERMATNFVDYAKSNARRMQIIGVVLVAVLVVSGVTLWAVGAVRSGQTTGHTILSTVQNATNPNSKISIQERKETASEIAFAVECVNNHTDRVSEANHGQPLEPVMAGCPAIP
jgi:hypothetical protein